MKKEMTELVFVLDASGSMSPMTKETLEGFNSMIQKQKEIESTCYVTTVCLSEETSTLHHRLPLWTIPPLTSKDYQPWGCTALLDAMGETICRIQKAEENLAEGVTHHVLFIIITDGEENASRQFTLPQVRRLVEDRQEAGWEFLFLGANMDAIAAAGDIGIAAKNAVEYVADEEGTALNYKVMSDVVRDYRQSGNISQQALGKIRKDRKKRG